MIKLKNNKKTYTFPLIFGYYDYQTKNILTQKNESTNKKYLILSEIGFENKINEKNEGIKLFIISSILLILVIFTLIKLILSNPGKVSKVIFN